jgi:streptogramin lyase
VEGINRMTFIDNKGRTWNEFTVSYRHELDDQTFSFTIWAIDIADAIERLEMIKANGVVDGKLIEVKA